MTDRPSPDAACHGCFPRPPASWRGAVEPDRPLRVSPACWGLHAELVGFELRHLSALGRFHELTVDAYGAQHAGPPTGQRYGEIRDWVDTLRTSQGHVHRPIRS